MRETLDDLPPRWRVLFRLSDADLASRPVIPHDRPSQEAAEAQKPHEQRLPAKLSDLEHELRGQPMANLVHAALIVLIRRQITLDAALSAYFRLWQAHEAMLLKGLSLRWLISAADTLVDHGRTPQERATAYATVLFVNTIKLYETERVFSLNIDPKEADLTGPQPQFGMDGITTFNVAKGDTVGNMYQRGRALTQEMGLSGKILDQAMARVNQLDTVFARFRKFHKGKHGW